MVHTIGRMTSLCYHEIIIHSADMKQQSFPWIGRVAEKGVVTHYIKFIVILFPVLFPSPAAAPAGRLGGLDYGFAVGFGEFVGVGLGRNLVVAAIELDVGAVVAVDDGYAAVLELGYDFVRFLVLAFLYKGDAVFEGDGQRVSLLREGDVLVTVFEVRA